MPFVGRELAVRHGPASDDEGPRAACLRVGGFKDCREHAPLGILTSGVAVDTGLVRLLSQAVLTARSMRSEYIFNFQGIIMS